MATPLTPRPISRRSDIPIAEGDLDEDLGKLVRRTSWLRQGFYCVVLLVALAGQVSGAVETLGIPLFAAIPAVGALELGGIVVLANADVRRRLGERAFASRVLSAAIAAAAVTFNWLAHHDHLLGGFFAGMSALGYLVWLMHTENQRRDRLRVKGDLPPTTPSYEIVGHWLRHPWLTVRAKAMAKADPSLGLYDSIAAARAEVKKERRQSAIAKVLHRKIRNAVDPRTADIAIAVYDLDEIAGRLAERADYDGLTAIIAADLAPHKLAPNGVMEEHRPQSSKVNGVKAVNGARTNGHALNGHLQNGVPLAIEFSDAGASGSAEVGDDAATATTVADDDDITVGAPAIPSGGPATEIDLPTTPARSRRRAATTPPIFTPDLREDVERALRPARAVAPAPAQRAVPDPEPVDDSKPLWVDPAADATSLRRRVHAALDAAVNSGDQRDDAELIGEIFDQLQLDSSERVAANSYVHSWRGQRIGSA
jgi:hypothetical protein